MAFVADEGEPTDGDGVASGRGLHEWQEWALGLDEGDFPCVRRLAFAGEGYPVPLLEEELKALADEDAPPDVQSVNRQLLAVLRQRPADTVAVLLTDGESGEDAEDEEEQGQ
jgi:hypothetical protein